MPAAVIAVVGLGDHGVADASCGAHRLRFVLHRLLARHRQAERRQDLVGLLLVARELHRDMRGASADRRLDALLVLAVPQLHQRLVVQAQPGDLARLRRAYERGSGRTERTPLRETDEFVARLGPAPALGHAAARTDFLRQQRAEEAQAQLARRDALVALRELVHHGVDPRALVDAACLAEGHVFAGDVLQLDRDVLKDVAEPRPLAFAHASEKAARLAIGAAVLGEAGQCGGEPVDVTGTEPAGGPGLQFAQVELETDDREPRVVRGPDVDRTVEDAHGVLPGRAHDPRRQGGEHVATARHG
jgi:hypothetical protein